jgi:hypothetical protein
MLKNAQKTKPPLNSLEAVFESGDLGEDRTLDPLIKSQLLYRLSYQVVVFCFPGCKETDFF